MSREKKKGTSGNAKAFITRAKALKKLQLSHQEFRRLCILKGIYPRDPKKKLEGVDKTYYLRKDIDFLAHERLISTIRQQNAHQKKEVKARAKRRIDLLKRLALSKPKARLDHLVVERYPHFMDAIRELDDPLCIVALFANLPADHRVGIAPKRVANCQRLLKEFHNFVAETRALKRVFVSIKGYYFQAKIGEELVTWVTPHRFSQVLPADVDYSVMLTFLELYECILSFVNFRLYTSENLAYPPKIGRVASEKGLELASVQIEKAVRNQAKDTNNSTDKADDEASKDVKPVSDEAVEKAQKMAITAQLEEEDEESDHDADKTEENEESKSGKDATTNEDKDDDGDKSEEDIESAPTGVFAGKSIVLGREVPYNELEFMLKAAGAARVTREDDLGDGADRLASYTHWIIDRPKVVGERNMEMEYVQPQYVFDSINAGMLLPTLLYTVGANLPPHLSPFVTEEDDGGYKPWFKDVLERIKEGDTSVVAEAAAVVYAEGKGNVKRKEGEGKKGEGSEGEDVDTEENKEKKLTKAGSAVRAKEDEVDDGMEVESDEEEDAGDKKKVKLQKRNRANDDDGDDKMDGDDGDEGEEEEDETDEGSEDSEEDDEEGEEELEQKEKEVELEKEGKEMATLMLSRKKMRLYRKQKRVDKAKSDVKERLTAKRKLLETQRATATGEQALRPKRRKR